MARAFVDRIIDDVREGREAQFAAIAGRPNDWLEAAKILVEVALFTKTVVETYLLLFSKTNQKTTKTEVQEAVGRMPENIDSDSRNKTIDKVRELLN